MICLRQKICFLEYISMCDGKGIKGKNNVQRDLSACVVQKFNGYEILKIQLKGIEKWNHEPIDIIYEPVNDEIHIQCFFTDDLHLAYRSYYSKKKMEATSLSIPLHSNATIAISILPGTKVGFMIM